MIVAGFEFTEDDVVAFFGEGFAGLDAGIVEFTALADDDGTGADQEDFFDRGIFRHGERALVYRISCVSRQRQTSANRLDFGQATATSMDPVWLIFEVYAAGGTSAE